MLNHANSLFQRFAKEEHSSYFFYFWGGGGRGRQTPYFYSHPPLVFDAKKYNQVDNHSLKAVLSLQHIKIK